MKRNEGFTLIELVVATAVLLILTLMMGSLFRQASSAWDTGRVRGEGGMIARAIVGAVSRDLATAIDGSRYESTLASPLVGGSSLAFVCLKPEPHLIEYKVSANEVTRSDQTWDGTQFGSATRSTLYRKRNNQTFTIDEPGSTFTKVESQADPSRDYEGSSFGAEWNGPAAVKIRVVFTQSGSFSGIEVRSFGANGVADEDSPKAKDDIVVR